MNYLAYIFRLLLRIKWWLILLPAGAAFLVYIWMGAMPRQYKSQTTVYTGVVSGYDIESTSESSQDWNVINNAVDNLINIIKAQTTLRNVSMRLFAQHMMYGDPNKDNQYITARNYRDLLARTPKEVQALIDPTSDSATLANLFDYETADHDNYVYGLFHWTHHHYSYEALNKIEVKRLNSSDMIEVSYQNDDPGMVYNTLLFLNDEFREQYKDLRFGETNNVIEFFESELRRVGDSLVHLENSLKDYNVENRVINYDEQTKHIAALTRDFELTHEEILLNYRSAEDLRTSLEEQIGEASKSFKDNAAFVQKLEFISDLQTRIAASKAFTSDDPTAVKPRNDVDALRLQLDDETRALKQITSTIGNSQYTKEGVSTPSMISKWLDAVLLLTKSKAELAVMELRRKELDDKYTQFSPVGSVIKQRQRSIDFTVQSYLSILDALNTARLRQKNLQMTSATLKIINPPVLPISAEPSKRKLTVLATFFAAFFFVLGFFILLELLDRTLRDKIRAERITGCRVLGAFPERESLRMRRYQKAHDQIAAQHLCNAVLNFFTSGQQNVVNFVSADTREGKSQLVQHLAEQLRLAGLSVRTLSWSDDFDAEQKRFLMARTLSDFVSEQKEGEVLLREADVILIEYPPFSKHSVPRDLLKHAALNLFVARADRTWKDTDQLLYEKAVRQADGTPIVLYLTNAHRRVVETFTGMLPPYTFLRKILFQLGQFGFTSTLK